MIRIEVTGYNDKPIAQSISADFDAAGGTIGRSPENTLVLLDPERKISRTHASLSHGAGGYTLRDQGSVVPVVLNGQPIGNGREAPIAPGDEIRIAGYVMSVRSTQTSEPAMADGVRDDRILPEPDTQPVTAKEAEPTAEEPAVSVPKRAEQAPAEPSLLVPKRTEPAPAEPPASVSIAEEVMPPVPAAPPVVEAAVPAAPTAAPETEMTEPVLSWTSTEAPGTIEAVTTIILSPAGQAFTETEGAQPEASSEATTAASASGSAASRATEAIPVIVSPNEALVRALLSGAGVREIDMPGGLTPEMMRQLGQLLREATSGLLDLLAARAMTKREVRADMTVIVAKDNNPLKFSPDIEAALTHLLVPRGRGFMPPLRAVADAYDDLRAHQLGFMAGMRSALAVVLARFDPRILEQKLIGGSVVDSILPTHRKAKLWDLFGELYGTLSNEAQNDFHVLFGREFLRAYQAHVVKLPERGESATKH